MITPKYRQLCKAVDDARDQFMRSTLGDSRDVASVVWAKAEGMADGYAMGWEEIEKNYEKLKKAAKRLLIAADFAQTVLLKEQDLELSEAANEVSNIIGWDIDEEES